MIKADIYEAGGLVLAETGHRIGIPLDGNDQERWGQTLRRSVLCDEIIEADPSQLSDPRVTLGHLGLDPENHQLRQQAGLIVAACKGADEAPTIRSHFGFRALEAIHVARLLRYSCDPDTALNYEGQWTQLERLSVAGQFLDSVRDASEDAERLPQFNARQLAYGGLWRAVKVGAQVRPETWKAFTATMREHGFTLRMRHLVKRSLSVDLDKMLQTTLPKEGSPNE